jgi:hypothetical protein
MSATSPAKIPSYTKHKSSGQAVVRINGRDNYLASFGSTASIKEYDRLRVEFIAGGHCVLGAGNTDLTITELAAAYWTHQKAYHGWGKNCGDYYCLRDVLHVVKELYADTPATEFGPLRLKACRQKMVEMDWSRRYTNKQTAKLVRMFKWAAAEELLPASVHVQLAAVEGLPRVVQIVFGNQRPPCDDQDQDGTARLIGEKTADLETPTTTP